MGNERLYPSIYGSITLRQKQIMASIAASSSSTPRPERGQLWRHRRNGVYAVVVRTGIQVVTGRVVITTAFDEETTPTLSDFVRENEYVIDFDGSRWIRGSSVYTVRLRSDDTVWAEDEDGDLDTMHPLRYFLETAEPAATPALASGLWPDSGPIATTGSDDEPAGAGGPARSRPTAGSSSSSSTAAFSSPAPRRGELWEHRLGGADAVVIGILEDGSVRAISRFGEISQGVDQFIELYTKVGEFDGSKWRDTFNTWGGTPIVTVSLTPSNTVKIVSSTGDIIMQSYGVKEFLDITTFQSAGPASAGSGGPARSRPTAGSSAASSSSSTAAFSSPAPRRGELWRQKHGRQKGAYSVVVEVGDKKLKQWNKFGMSTRPLSFFLAYGEYVGDFDGSRWTYDGETVSVRLANDDEDVMMVDENGNEWPVPIQSFFAFATFVSAGPVLGSRRNVKKRKRATSSSSSPGTRMPDDLRNAISNGTAEEVKELLAKGYDVNAIYEDGPQTVLWLALFNRNVEMVKLLLACGADVNPKLRDVNLRRGATYLLLLLAVEDPAGTGELMEMFKLLLEAGANINATYERRTMLQLAKEKGKFDFLVEMLKYSEREKTTCAICFEPFGAAPALIVKLACGHMFHRTCISKWAGSNSTCPECRRPIDPSELQGQGEIFVVAGNDADGNVVYKVRQELKF